MWPLSTGHTGPSGPCLTHRIPFCSLLLHTYPNKQSLTQSLPLNLRSTEGGGEELSRRWLLEEGGQEGELGEGLLQETPVLSLEPRYLHTPLVGEGEGEPGTHVYPAPLHHAHGHI